MITPEQRELTAAIIGHATEKNPNLDHHTEALIRALGSMIEGIPVDRAMGAPGAWGYGTPIGDALLAMYCSRTDEKEVRVVEWIPVGFRLPDVELTVMIHEDDGEVSTGFLDNEVWRYVSADRVNANVIHWAEMPAGPSLS